MKMKLNRVQINSIVDFKEKINNGIIKFEKTFCPVCKHNKSKNISTKDRYGLDYFSQLCKDCGLVYTNPIMDKESTYYFYNSYYRNIYNGINQEKNFHKFFNDQVSKGHDIFKFIKHHLPNFNIHNVLEVGCGMGGILLPFKHKGINILGIDLDEKYISIGKKKGLNLKIQDVHSIKNQKFDLIIYNHCFEHLINLEKELTKIKSLMTKNGVLYIEVPGILNLHQYYKSDINRYFQNAHNFNFSLGTLKNILSINEFKLIYGNEKVSALFQRDYKINNLIIENYYQHIETSLKNFKTQKIYYNLTKIGIKRNLISMVRFLGLLTILLKIKNILKKKFY